MVNGGVCSDRAVGRGDKEIGRQKEVLSYSNRNKLPKKSDPKGYAGALVFCEEHGKSEKSLKSI